MLKNLPLGKIIGVSVVVAAVGYLVVFVANLGLAENGPLAIAVGLFVGFIGGAVFILKALSVSPDGKAKPAPSASHPSQQVSIFVGNLAYKVRGRQLAELFEPYGEIKSIRIVKDRETGKGKGFGFVDMNGPDAMRAIKQLDGSELYGRTLKVCEANSQKT